MMINNTNKIGSTQKKKSSASHTNEQRVKEVIKGKRGPIYEEESEKVHLKKKRERGGGGGGRGPRAREGKREGGQISRSQHRRQKEIFKGSK